MDDSIHQWLPYIFQAIGFIIVCLVVYYKNEDQKNSKNLEQDIRSGYLRESLDRLVSQIDKLVKISTDHEIRINRLEDIHAKENT